MASIITMATIFVSCSPEREREREREKVVKFYKKGIIKAELKA